MEINNTHEALGRIKGIADFLEAFGVGRNDEIFKAKADRLMACAEFIQKHLGESEEGDAWKTIDTAPKDGTLIDLWLKDGLRITNCKWDKDAWRYYWIDSFESMGWIEIDGVATNWMPLPQAPGA